MSRESVNKQLRQWQLGGIITMDHGSIALTDERALQRFAEPEA
jgi:hypothetical protein